MTRSLQCKTHTTSYLLYKISRDPLILNCSSSSKVTAYRQAAKYSSLSVLKSRTVILPSQLPAACVSIVHSHYHCVYSLSYNTMKGGGGL